jgi:ribosomal protein S12 methylthiotransferase accessory factor
MVSGVERLRAELRVVPPQITLQYAKAWAPTVGLEQVRDITSIDCLGVPIFVGERPGARSGAYSFGKGLVPIHSEVGAYMEAIETYFSEPGVAQIETRLGLPSELSGVRQDCNPLLEFAPRVDCGAPLDRPILLARAEDLERSDQGWIPAELAFNPSPLDSNTRLFGSSGNGLASGNTVLEASVHALFELIERDIWSIEFVRNRSVRVEDDDLPPYVNKIVDLAERHGLRLVIRYVPNDYGIPFFSAFIYDANTRDSRHFNGGWGCHHARDVALQRAVTEAAQGRAAILGGWRETKPGVDTAVEAARFRLQIDAISRKTSSIRFGDISEQPASSSLDAQWNLVVRQLRLVVDRPIYRLIYTPSDGPLHVVRLIVPLMENFTRSTLRVGPRMLAELEAAGRVD